MNVIIEIISLSITLICAFFTLATVVYYKKALSSKDETIDALNKIINLGYYKGREDYDNGNSD